MSLLFLLGVALKAEEPAAVSSEGAPRAVVDQPVYDFGLLAPSEVAEHTFVVRNEGDSLLRIHEVVASCKCVLPEEVKGGLEPGETADVKVAFKGKPTESRYVQTVTLSTNDPKTPRLSLKIVGKIAPDIVVLPDKLLLPRLEPNAPVESRLDLVSAVWEEFEIVDVRTTSDAIEVTHQDIPAKGLESRRATAGKAVEVAIGPSLTGEDFKEQIFFTVKPTKPDAPEKTLKVPVVGSVRGSLRVLGPGIDAFGRMKLGAIDPVVGATKNYVVKVVDSEESLEVVHQEVVPEYVRVELEPYRDTGSTRLYRLRVTVPPGKPVSGYTGPNAGKIRLEFNHPRIKDLEMALEMLPAAPR